jgi:RNA polymerase sigma factor (sigma-70 family)
MDDMHLSVLISKVANRDMEAFEELYKIMKRGVYSFALSHANNRQLAEDIVQETFLHILKASENYSHQNPKAWILTISRNVSLNMLRKRKNEILSYEDVDSDMVSIGDFVDGICNSTIIQILLTKLEPSERQIIVLHLVSELKHREIAEILELPLGTVLWKYNTSIKKLKKLVD